MQTAHAQRTVMIVDDEPVIRSLLALLLEGEDYRVTTAEDGRDALAKMDDRRPDVLVLDLMLPNVDGWGVIDSLDRDAEEKHIPIIAVSAGQRKVAVGERGVKAFLSKPFELDTLLVVLDEVLH